MDRRDAMRLLALAPLATALEWTIADVHQAGALARAAIQQGTFVPRFFTPHEYATVRLLSNLIIPKDERSGSAGDAGVPEFMDFMMVDGSEAQRLAMRGGLAWLDAESRERYAASFIAAKPGQRADLLDDIAYPARAPEHLSQGVAFFNRFRDLTASGFFSSRMGHDDLHYTGNVPTQWNGCPQNVLAKLDVRYE